MIRSIFPKFLPHLDADTLCARLAGCGLDGVNLVVRDGYWCRPGSLAEDVPRFAATARRHGLAVPIATACWEPTEVIADPARLRLLADQGITAFRTAYLPRGGDPRAAFAAARGLYARLAEICLAAGVRAIHQVHHGTLIASASAAWRLVEGLPPTAIGIKLDPGNQMHEGWEDPGWAAALLGPHLAAVGVKDVAWRRGDGCDGPRKGWTRDWAPCDEGCIDWHAVAAGLRAAGFAGPLVFMPFHTTGDTDAHLAAVAREVAWVRRAFASIP